jgi:hypothetical protein
MHAAAASLLDSTHAACLECVRAYGHVHLHARRCPADDIMLSDFALTNKSNLTSICLRDRKTSTKGSLHVRLCVCMYTSCIHVPFTCVFT